MKYCKQLSVRFYLDKVLLCLCFLLLAGQVQAQEHRAEDSLRRELVSGKLPVGTRIVAMTKLAHILYYRKSHKDALALLQAALQLARPIKDKKYVAGVYAALSTQSSNDFEPERARKYIDSALYYSPVITDEGTLAYIYYCNGWLKVRENEPQEAIASFLKGVKLLEGTDYSQVALAAMYGEMAGIYDQWNDRINQEKYARLGLKTAIKSKVPDVLTAAHYNMATCFVSRFKSDTTRRYLLDSALYHNKRSMAILRENTDQITHLSERALTARNIAEIYSDHMPAQYKETALRYIDTAMDVADRTGDHMTLSRCYIMLAAYAVREEEYTAADRYIFNAIGELYKEPIIDNRTEIRINEILAVIKEKQGDLPEALRYYKQYINAYKNIFDNDKMGMGKMLEARYEGEKKEKALLQARYEVSLKDQALTEARYETSKKEKDLLLAKYEAGIKDKALMAAGYEAERKNLALTTAQYKTEQKEQQLVNMQQKIEYNNRLNLVYIILTIASLLALVFLFYAYKQRSKTLKQEQQLHQFEVDNIRQEHRISLLSAMLDGQEQERTRLARDLHDGLGGLLSGVKIELSGLLSESGYNQQQGVVHRTLNHLDNAVDELRRIAKSMMPEVLLVYGLGEATREYCKGLQATGIPVTCQVVNYKNDMIHARQIVLYRIMQELVNNAVKHAAATQILVQIQQSDNTLFLTVEDDGRGFDKNNAQQLKGAGLANIQARVELLQGRFDLDSERGTGTTCTIECSVI